MCHQTSCSEKNSRACLARQWRTIRQQQLPYSQREWLFQCQKAINDTDYHSYFTILSFDQNHLHVLTAAETHVVLNRVDDFPFRPPDISINGEKCFTLQEDWTPALKLPQVILSLIWVL